MKISDQRIIEMLFDRDERALAVAENKYGALCRKIAYKITGDYDESDECVNNSLFELWNAIPPARPKSLKAYLCGIVRNISVDIIRKRKKYTAAQTNIEELIRIFPDSENVETSYDGKMLCRYLNEFLSEQKDMNQKIFVMRYYYNFSVQDISQMLDIKDSAVKTRLFRIREALKLFLIDKGYDL